MAINADSVTVELIAKTDGYNAKIKQAAANFDSATSTIEKGSARAANASRNLGRQISDIGTGLATGQNPFFIIAQQSGQVADALADTGGKAAKVAAFFAGPWGAALLAAGSALGILVGKALEGGESIQSLTRQLEKNAEKSRLTAEAQRVFETTAIGAAEAVDKLNESLGKANQTQERAIGLDLARAKSLREVSIRALMAAEASARQTISESAMGPVGANATGSAGAAAAAQIGLDRRRADAQRILADAQRARAKAEEAVSNAAIPALDARAAAATDKAAAATRRHSIELQRLRDAYNAANKAAASGPAGNAARVRANEAYRAGAEANNRRLQADQDAIRDSKKKGPKGPSAETLARRAETARVREVRNNEAYNSELEQINGQVIAAQKERAVNAAEIANFERDDIERQFRDRQVKIAADLSAKKYTQAQADELNQRNEYAKSLRLRNVAINEEVRSSQERAARDALTLGIEQSQLEADQAIAETRAERRRIELELIKLKYQERDFQLKALREQAQARGDINRVNDINEQIGALPGLRKAEEAGVNQRYRGRFEQYRRDLNSADSLQDSIDGIKIQTLESVTDELTNATKAALGLKGAFGDIVGQLIKIGIQRKLIGPLSDALFGKADGSTSGAAGDALSSIFKSLAGGRASGGNVVAGKLYKINENGPELFQPGQSGKVYPTGSIKGASASGVGTTIIQQTFALDARGGVVTQDLLRQVNAISAQKAAQAGQAAYQNSPARSQRLATLGT